MTVCRAFSRIVLCLRTCSEISFVLDFCPGLDIFLLFTKAADDSYVVQVAQTYFTV